MSQVFQYLYDHLLHFLFWPALLLFLLFLVPDWLRAVWWTLRRDSSWTLPESEPPPAPGLRSRLERDNARRQAEASREVKYRVQHVPQPRPLELEDQATLPPQPGPTAVVETSLLVDSGPLRTITDQKGSHPCTCAACLPCLP